MKIDQQVRFDDSLRVMVELLVDELGTAALDDGVAVRDVAGRLAFFVNAELQDDQAQRLSAHLTESLGPYARTDRVLGDVQDFGAEELFDDPGILPTTVAGHTLRLIDRRLVGSDWLRAPAAASGPPRRFVFASMKGGVGRSTALSVAAYHFAAIGLRILAVDLDMEAPGLGAMLLDEGTLPEFGFVDALVENGLGGLDERFLADMRGPSALAQRQGRIDVIPAFGKRSRANPAEVLSKISRAYTEDVSPEGKVSSILDQVREVIDLVADPAKYDAVFIDARAGLHETSASAILGLGADVFLFGIDEPQTFQGYGYLLAHLARFVPGPAAPRPEWLERLTMVQGRAPASEEARAGFAERCVTMFREAGLSSGPENSAEVIPLPAEPFGAVPWEDSGGLDDEETIPDDRVLPAPPITILDEPLFRSFDPIHRVDWIAAYLQTYGALLRHLGEPLLTAPKVDA